MADAIDPRLFAAALPPRAQPYYLPSPSPTHTSHPPLPPPPPPPPLPSQPALDPALAQTQPSGSQHTAAGGHDGNNGGHDGSNGHADYTNPCDHDHDHDRDHDHDHDHSHDHDDPISTPSGTLETPGSARSPGDFKRLRACDSCRGLKVRCDQERPDQSCRRCAKAGRPCITTPPTRKRQKKADSRVAELERKIDALTATLHAQKTPSPDTGTNTTPHSGFAPSHLPPPIAAPEGPFHAATLSHDWGSPAANRFPHIPPGYSPAQNMARGPEPKRRKFDTAHATTASEATDAIHRDLAEHADTQRNRKTKLHAHYSHINTYIDGLMSPEVAERIFVRYVTEMCRYFPAVPFAPGTTAREVRDQKPLLFLAILAGSSHGSSELLVSQDVQRQLIKALKDQLADIIWRDGQKSIEIIQALQISVFWYRPPLHFEQHSFYMMVNCAAVMALDLGLGRKATPNVMRLSVGPFRRYYPDSSTIESRRTFLVCYYLCMSITMVLRRPILLRWTKYMDESVKILQTSPDAFPSDRLLCQHVKMAHIGESISVQFSMDDPSMEVAISEPRVIYALKIFENELQQLRDENANMGGVDPTIKLAEHITSLHLHEIALHQNQGATDFQPPFEDEPLAASVVKKDVPIGPAHLGALGECLTATHGILDTILGIELDIILALPVIFCVRAIYAIVCLMKIWVTATSSGEVRSIIKEEDLKIESFTERLCAMLKAIVSRDAQSPHGKFYFVAKRLQERFAEIKEGSNKTVQSETDFAASQTPAQGPIPASCQPSISQTPLHLLSEVAMGSTATATPVSTPSYQQTQTQAHSHSQQQAQAALQAHAQNSEPSLEPNWYAGIPAPVPDFTGFEPNFDMDFDFTAFDLGTGSDADLSALFIPDSMHMWAQYPEPGDGDMGQQQQQQQQQVDQGYNGF